MRRGGGKCCLVRSTAVQGLQAWAHTMPRSSYYLLAAAPSSASLITCSPSHLWLLAISTVRRAKSYAQSVRSSRNSENGDQGPGRCLLTLGLRKGEESAVVKNTGSAVRAVRRSIALRRRRKVTLERVRAQVRVFVLESASGVGHKFGGKVGTETAHFQSAWSVGRSVGRSVVEQG